MSYDQYEQSVELASPVELYTFRVYGTNFRYTSAGTQQTVASLLYLPYALNHGPFESTDELPKNSIDIDCPLDFPVLDFYEGAPPSDVITLTISRFHRNDPDQELRVIWRGRVLNGKRIANMGKLYCENKFTSIKQMGLRRTYGAGCPHVLYGPACKAVEADFQITTTVDGVSGTEISAAIFDTFDDGRFAGGVVKFEPTPGRIEKRGIASHSGDTIVLTHPFAGLAALDSIIVSPGCKHDRPDCNDFFDNILNYGGFDYVPRQNPMGQTSVF
jgi:hypothetical protein